MMVSKEEILKLYPSIAAFCADAKISETQIYGLLNGRLKLTRIMERRIRLALEAKARRNYE